MARRAKKEHWCDCPGGPQPVAFSGAPVHVDHFSVGRNGSEDSKVFFPEAFDGVVDVGDLALEHLARIDFTFWKPIEIPIDLTVELKPRKPDE